jgi:splicing factor 3A subunit 3
MELIRLNHELAEQCEQAICAELDEKPSGQKAKTWQQHKISNILNDLVGCNKEILDQYADSDGLMKEELESLKGKNMFSSFYEAVNATREYHQRFPDAPSKTKKVAADVEVQFSGEEVFGKYLDLNDFFLRFCNLPNVNASNQDYLQYLDRFNSFFYIQESAKSHKSYVNYVKDLERYLFGFLKRIQPLFSLDDLVEEWNKSFGDKWEAGTVNGWKRVAQAANGTSSGNGTQHQALRLGMFNAPSELEALGMDRLKEALMALGLKCGGTLKDRAERLWMVRGKKPEDFPPKLLAKKTNSDSNGAGVRSNGDSSDDSSQRKETAWMEYKIAAVCDLMMDIVTATRKHAEKQQTRSVEEKEAEIREEEFGTLPDVEEDEKGADDDEEALYNPKNLPLGYDGKPIPYWLYKLHGLGVEYKCEVCGNQSYWGRRNFDRHFQEWRHAHGMRCLGVPNTKHFHDITLIEDVLSLYAKIKDTLVSDQFIGEVHEEFEDSEGNVLNRRTYEDLARQGLL